MHLHLHDLIGFGIMAFWCGMLPGLIAGHCHAHIFQRLFLPENSGEYFGIYDIFAKGASFLGSLVIAAVKLAGGTMDFGKIGRILLLLAGLFGMSAVFSYVQAYTMAGITQKVVCAMREQVNEKLSSPAASLF